jgi:protein-tyrosine kinase
MLIPKASHLVERVAERLLRAGALDDSAAQLLQPGSASAPATEAAAAGAAAPDDAGAAAARPASSLFAPPPAVPGPPPIAALAPQPATGLDPQSAASPGPQPAASPALPAAVNPAARQNGDPAIPARAAPSAVAQPLTLPPIGQPESPPADLASPNLASPNLASPNLASPSIPGRTRPPGETSGQADRPAMPPVQSTPSIDAVSLERAGMVDWSRTRTRISEEFRLVQRQILRSAFGPGAEPGFSNLLLVTSARPGEGKSFTATNLSGSIARQGDHHVLLVDADSKRDSICYTLGLAQAYGLLDLVANPKLDPAPLIVKTPIERLSILPVGRERERSAELFSTKDMTRLIQSLGRRYADRLLVLDAPPCLSTSDPAVLSQVVGQILFVVEADRTQRDEIEASLDLIQACPTITLVLNKQQVSSRYTFGAYSSYYSS